MTVGDLFLLTLFIFVVILIISYIVYICILRILKKKGYKHPKEKVAFMDVANSIFIISISVTVLVIIIWQIIVNWNVVI